MACIMIGAVYADGFDGAFGTCSKRFFLHDSASYDLNNFTNLRNGASLGYTNMLSYYSSGNAARAEENKIVAFLLNFFLGLG